MRWLRQDRRGVRLPPAPGPLRLAAAPARPQPVCHPLGLGV